MILRIETRPSKIVQNTKYQFQAKLFENEKEITIDQSSFKWCCAGGVIDENGLYTATSGGPCTVYVTYANVQGELTDSFNFAIEREAEKLQSFFKKNESPEAKKNGNLDLKTEFEVTKQIVDHASKKVTREEMRERAKQAREAYKDLGAHTRAVIRMSKYNKSFINLILCLIAGVGFGISGMIILYDFNIYAVLLFFCSLFLVLKGGVVAIMELRGPIESKIAEKYESIARNQDLLWIAIAIIASVVIGASAYLLVNGVAISTIITLFTSLLALFLSIIGKATSQQGDIAKSMTKRINKQSVANSYYTIDEKNN